jgi:hypothetical protein
MAAKSGMVRIHPLRVLVEMEGRARSARRSISGPEPGRGAATRVRRVACWGLRRFGRLPSRRRGRGSIVDVCVMESWKSWDGSVVVAQSFAKTW